MGYIRVSQLCICDYISGLNRMQSNDRGSRLYDCNRSDLNSGPNILFIYVLGNSRETKFCIHNC